jgi:hypothetical protein
VSYRLKSKAIPFITWIGPETFSTTTISYYVKFSTTSRDVTFIIGICQFTYLEKLGEGGERGWLS